MPESTVSKPSCFGSNPSYQSQAENDCQTCHWQKDCLVEKPVSNVDKTLAERGSRYGNFDGHACITQRLKRDMKAHQGGKAWDRLNASQKEALEMIVHKIGRILNGDPNYADSWHDIAGYSKLVEDELNAKQP